MAVDGRAVAIALPANLGAGAKVSVSLAAGALVDLQGAAVAGKTVSFTTAATAKAVTPLSVATLAPANVAPDTTRDRSGSYGASTKVPAGDGGSITMAFNRAVSLTAAAGNITIWELNYWDEVVTFQPYCQIALTDRSQVEVLAEKLIVRFTRCNLYASARFRLTFPAGAVQDETGAVFGGLDAGAAWHFNSELDTKPPFVMSTVPKDKATKVNEDEPFILVFDDVVWDPWGLLALCPRGDG